jgi:mRNA export factor
LLLFSTKVLKSGTASPEKQKNPTKHFSASPGYSPRPYHITSTTSTTFTTNPKMASFGNNFGAQQSFGSPMNQPNNNQQQAQDFVAQGDYMQGKGLSNIVFKKTPTPQPKELLCASSWDNKVYTFQVQVNQQGQVGQASQVQACQFPKPTMDVCFGVPQSPHDNNVFAACADNGVYMMTNFNQSTKIGQFNAPVSAVRAITVNNTPMVIATSWDRTLKLFDARQPNPAVNVNLSERVYCMDARNVNGSNGIAVACTADRKCHVFQFPNFQRPVTDNPTTLKKPPRCVAVTPDGTGICVGSIEGRIAVHYFADPNAAQKKTFAFKCHRQNKAKLVFPVNDITFSPFNTFVTAGSDGIYNIWDIGEKQRLKARPPPPVQTPMPIVSTDFNSAGTVLAFAESYDWFRGAQHEQMYKNTRLCLHTLTPNQVQPKKMTGGGGNSGRKNNNRRSGRGNRRR